jgi:hypothetical protein
VGDGAARRKPLLVAEHVDGLMGRTGVLFGRGG